MLYRQVIRFESIEILSLVVGCGMESALLKYRYEHIEIQCKCNSDSIGWVMNWFCFFLPFHVPTVVKLQEIPITEIGKKRVEIWENTGFGFPLLFTLGFGRSVVENSEHFWFGTCDKSIILHYTHRRTYIPEMSRNSGIHVDLIHEAMQLRYVAHFRKNTIHNLKIKSPGLW